MLKRSAENMRIQDREEFRAITIIGLLQCACIFVGLFVVFIWTKLLGYTEGCAHVSDLAALLRHYGGLLLLIPLAWILGLVVAERKQNYKVSELIGDSGPVIIAVLAVFFIFVCITAFRPSLVQVVTP